MSTHVRAAAAVDAEAIARLCEGLGYVATAVEVETRRGAIAELPGHALFVADVDGAVRGWLHAAVSHAIHTDRCVEILALVVDETARSQSLGAQLVAAAERWAQAQGIPRMRLRSRDTRERAHRFYEREGYRTVKTSKVFEKRLESE